MTHPARIALVALAGLLCFGPVTACRTGSTDPPAPQPAQSPQTPIAEAAAAAERAPVPAKSRVKYVALGDSTGVGVGASQGGGYVDRIATRLRATGTQVDLINLSVSGATTSDVLRSQLDRAIAAEPTLITLGIGINDAGHGGPVETFAQNFDRITDKLVATGAPVVVTNIPDMSLAPVTKVAGISETWVNERIRSFNKVIAETASRRGLLTFDMFTTSRELIPEHPEFFSGDGFHPSAEGYEAWASRMWPTVERAAATGRKKPNNASL